MGLVIVENGAAVEADDVKRVVVNAWPTDKESGKIFLEAMVDGKFIHLAWVKIPIGTTTRSVRQLLARKIKQINDARSNTNNKKKEGGE